MTTQDSSEDARPRQATMRSAIASAIWVAGKGAKAAEQADSVLDTDEMQAIRLALHNVGVRHAAGADVRWSLIWNELPDTVKAWVR